MADDLHDAISENAKGPKRVRGDSSEVEQHDLDDLIAADKYLASKAAATSKGLGIRLTKTVPPGTV